jgi:hypothetical protein
MPSLLLLINSAVLLLTTAEVNSVHKFSLNEDTAIDAPEGDGGGWGIDEGSRSALRPQILEETQHRINLISVASGTEVEKRRMLSSATSDLIFAYGGTPEGGTVELQTGTTFAPDSTQNCIISEHNYNPALCVTKAVKFQCLDTAAKCTLDGSSNKRLLMVNSGKSDTTEFTGLIVRRGLADSSRNFGSGMTIWSSKVAISLCDFTSNSALVSIDEKKASRFFTFYR